VKSETKEEGKLGAEAKEKAEAKIQELEAEVAKIKSKLD
jgi:uncharacterized protein YceH (UPF0502 family)